MPIGYIGNISVSRRAYARNVRLLYHEEPTLATLDFSLTKSLRSQR